MAIIDSHVHIMPQYRTDGLVRWIKKAFPEHPSWEGMTPDDILEQLEDNGMVLGFNFVFPLKEEETAALNTFSREIADTYPFLVPFGSMHVETADKAGVAEYCLSELGLAGIKIHPYAQRFEVFCSEFEPMLDVLERYGRPFIVHSGFDAFYNRTQDLGYLECMLDSHPDLPVVLVHSLFPRFALAYRLMSRHPLLYLDMTNVPGTLALFDSIERAGWSGDVEDIPAADRDHLNGLFDDFSDRIMFGTDHPVGMGSPERIYADLKDLGLREEGFLNLTFDTAATFLDEHCGDAGKIARGAI